MFDSLPKDASKLARWRWADIEPYYQDLYKRRLSDESVTAFLADWTRLNEVLDEALSRFHVATTVNTA
ncbi:MAG: M3 family oligoendopeptidase, partial [Deltaproteobacteria bacterium]|nr:M3 family oligoendopeptidase [Deltaproteobacteria bacterium]